MNRQKKSALCPGRVVAPAPGPPQPRARTARWTPQKAGGTPAWRPGDRTHESYRTDYKSRRSGSALLISGYKLLKSGYALLKTGYELLKSGCKFLKTGSALLKSGYALLKSGYKLLKAGSEQLESGTRVVQSPRPPSAPSALSAVPFNSPRSTRRARRDSRDNERGTRARPVIHGETRRKADRKAARTAKLISAPSALSAVPFNQPRSPRRARREGRVTERGSRALPFIHGATRRKADRKAARTAKRLSAPSALSAVPFYSPRSPRRARRDARDNERGSRARPLIHGETRRKADRKAPRAAKRLSAPSALSAVPFYSPRSPRRARRNGGMTEHESRARPLIHGETRRKADRKAARTAKLISAPSALSAVPFNQPRSPRRARRDGRGNRRASSPNLRHLRNLRILPPPRLCASA